MNPTETQDKSLYQETLTEVFYEEFSRLPVKEIRAGNLGSHYRAFVGDGKLGLLEVHKAAAEAARKVLEERARDAENTPNPRFIDPKNVLEL